MTDRKIADGLIMTSKRVENNEQLLLADHGFRRDIVVTGMGMIYYVVNRHNLNLNYHLNKDDEAKEALANMNDFIAKGWEFKNIEINAWASPEGEESFNQGLSQRRSETAQKYVEDAYKKYLKKAQKNLVFPLKNSSRKLNLIFPQMVKIGMDLCKLFNLQILKIKISLQML